MWVYAGLELLTHWPQPPKTGITGASPPPMLTAYSSYFITDSSYMRKHLPTTNQGITAASTHQVPHKDLTSLRHNLVLRFLWWRLWNRFLCVVFVVLKL